MVGIRRHIDLIIGSALSVAGMFYFGSIARIEYDGWWHIFIAREDSWRRFFGDIYASAHPPVYYLLLKAASQLGSSPLLYRSPSIIAAGAAIIIMGLTAKRIIRHRGIAILCTLAFGLATSTVIIANEVRQYMTAVLFILVAFYFFLDLVQPSAGTRQVRSRLGFALASSVAVCTHYSAIFFVFAAMATPLPGYHFSWLQTFAQVEFAGPVEGRLNDLFAGCRADLSGLSVTNAPL